MPLPNITGEIIAQGYNCHVRIKKTESSNLEAIALVASFQATEDFQVQEAVCLGNLGPVALDPQGYTCQITFDGFLPYKGKLNGNSPYDGTGGTAMMDIMPMREDYMEAGKFDNKIDYLELWNKKAGVIAAFQGVIITNNGISVDGNAYARNNVQARALSRIKAA
jgi:hypothetical protein